LIQGAPDAAIYKAFMSGGSILKVDIHASRPAVRIWVSDRADPKRDSPAGVKWQYAPQVNIDGELERQIEK
jgi:hypothetical protein